MRLALKLVLVFMLANTALALVYGCLAVYHEEEVFQREVEEEAGEMAYPLRLIVADAWRINNIRGVREALQQYCSEPTQPLRVRWVWLESPDDETRPVASLELLATVATKDQPELRATNADGTAYLVIYCPVLLSGRRGALEFAHSTAALKTSERNIIVRTGVLVVGMALISGFLAVLLGVRFIGQPLERLIAKVRQIGAGNLEGLVHIRSHDELEELAENLNAMCADLAESQRKLRDETAARIAAIEQLRHADRLKTVGRLASGIAHELGTPLNVVAGRAALIGSGKLDVEEIARSAAAIRAEADKMTLIIRQLLDFARASTPRKQPVDLRSVVRQTIDLLGSIAEKHKVRLQFEPCAETAIADVDAGQIQQVLTNLTMNAIQAMPQGGPVEFRIVRRTRPHPEKRDVRADYFAIEIQDHGVGIPPENLPQLFEPFFTTKEVGAGTGLGLSIAYGIVQEHGGCVEVASEAGKGSCFTVFLPAGGPA